MSNKIKTDKIFAFIVFLLISFGSFLFLSASMGLLAKDNGNFLNVFLKQIGFGLGGGLILMFFLSRLDYRKYKKYAFYIFLGSLIMSCLVFVPGIGFEHGGAKRWLDIFGFSFQPAELLKISFVVYFAAFLSAFKSKLNDWKYSILPILILLSFVAALSFFQPDYGTLVIIIITAFGMLLTAEVNFKHLSIIIGSATLAVIPLALYKTYIIERLLTFLRPAQDALGASYQINQSLVAIGSGGFWGKGFGKSVQKFGLLPEPMGDSIFAVTAEEWGFVGCLFLITLFLLFAIRGLRIATHSTDVFGRLLAIGIVILIVSQSFINIASMLGIFPMIGMPLIFVSQGGTALLFALAEVGILLNISKYSKQK
ncbi:FtsW/RodA/SpoVE family cell cycle protein [Patescibacteria group bacterium]|nr:FtsW/RodA/SpoVE family cell cycle protein [Patescibacteria group bacterium]